MDETDIAEPLRGLEPIKDTKVAPAQGIAALALSMAVKYHDIGTVKDGALYQQYKLEGKNLIPLHLDMVFETAIKMEAYLLGADERIAKLIDALEVTVDENEAQQQASPAAEKSE